MKKNGFTLIELMVVITIIAILAAIGAVMYSSTQKAARDSKRKQDLQSYKKALFVYQTNFGNFCLGAASGGGSANCWLAVTNDPIYGINGTATNSLKNTLTPTFLASAPTDPLSTQQYILFLSGQTFILSAILEGSPPSNLGCTPYTGYNYCITE